MNRVNGLSAILFVSALIIGPCSAAQAADPNALALKGLKTVFVLVEELPAAAIQMGLTKEMVKNEAESKLRQAGLSVPTFSYEDPYLFLRLSVVGEAFSLEASLRDYVVLKRDRKIACAAAIWMKNLTGVHHGDGSVFLEALREVLDSFLNDLRVANPKKPPK